MAHTQTQPLCCFFCAPKKSNNIRNNRSQVSLAYNDAHNESCYCCPISITFCHYAEAILFMIHQKWWCSYFDQISFTQMTLPKPSRCWDLNYQSIFQETWLDSNIPLKLGDLFEFEKEGNSKVLPLFCLPACNPWIQGMHHRVVFSDLSRIRKYPEFQVLLLESFSNASVEAKIRIIRK